jgi:sporulation protein YabP
MALEEKKTVKSHALTLANRQEGTLTGVLDVQSFDEEEVMLLTEAGKLKIQGEHLHIRNLNLEQGEVELEGKVNSLVYLSKTMEKKDESLLKRMFR